MIVTTANCGTMDGPNGSVDTNLMKCCKSTS